MFRHPFKYKPALTRNCQILALSTGATSAAAYDYCSADDSVPDYISADDEDEELPVRWKAPECITKHRYSSASDTWAFGILMYEVFTYGCIPYKHISDDKEVASHVGQCFSNYT